MLVSDSDVIEYARAQGVVSSGARRELNAFLAQIWLLDMSTAARQKAIADFVTELVAGYSSMSSVLAGEFLDNLGVKPIAATVADSRVVRSAYWAMNAPGITDRSAALGQVTDRLTMQGGRDVIDLSAWRSDKVRYARVPTGKACAFCVMLASRGAVYGSAQSAGDGNRYHADCHCVPTPVRKASELPDMYRQARPVYAALYRDARKGTGGDTKAILSNMRAAMSADPGVWRLDDVGVAA